MSVVVTVSLLPSGPFFYCHLLVSQHEAQARGLIMRCILIIYQIFPFICPLYTSDT